MTGKNIHMPFRVRSLSRLHFPARVLAIFMMLVPAAHVEIAMAGEPLKIVVYGASGNIGSRIAGEAVSRGHHVTGVSRNAEKLEDRISNIKAVQGDIFDVGSIREIVAGQDVVINVIGDDSNNMDPAQHPVRRSAESLVAALRELENPPRLIALVGAAMLEVRPGTLLFDTMDLQPGTPPMILITGHKLAFDFYHANPDIKWTIASPSRHIAAGERTGEFRLSGSEILRDAAGEFTSISYEDFAVAVIDEAERGNYIGRQFTAGY